MSVYTPLYTPLYQGAPGGWMAIPLWAVQVDWANNGNFTDAGDDISARTLDTAAMTIQYGRDQARALAPPAPGRAAFLIDNASRDYSPDNASSALAPNVLPARPVLVTGTLNFLAGDGSTFEGGIATWGSTGNCSVAQTAAQAHSGTKSLKLTSAAAGNMSAGHASTLTDWMPCIPGEQVTCTAWFRAATVARAVLTAVQFADTGGTSLGTTFGSNVPDTTTGWTQPPATVATAPAGAAWCRARGQVNATGAAGEDHYVDDVTLSAGFITYRGFFDTYDVQPQDHTVSVTCIDVLGRFSAATPLSTPLYFSITTGQAVGYILDAMGWPGGARDIDPGATMIRWWWEEQTDGLTALQKVIASEGPPAIAFIDAQTGNFCFRDRSHRLVRPASVTSQAAWADSGPEPVFSAPFGYDLGWRDVVNSVIIPVAQRDQQGTLSVVWQDGPNNSYLLAYLVPVYVTVQGLSDPFTGAITPVYGTDFTSPTFASAITVSLSRTSGQSTTISLRLNTGGAGATTTVTGLQLRAYTVSVAATTQVTATDSASITANGVKGLPPSAQPVWASANDAAAVAALILAQRAKRLPTVQVTFDGIGNATVLTQQLGRDLSDRVTLTEYETGLTNIDFFVEQIKHEISDGGARLVTTFGCEKAPATAQPLILDDPVWGKLDTGGVLGI